MKSKYAKCTKVNLHSFTLPVFLLLDSLTLRFLKDLK